MHVTSKIFNDYMEFVFDNFDTVVTTGFLTAKDVITFKANLQDVIEHIDIYLESEAQRD